MRKFYFLLYFTVFGFIAGAQTPGKVVVKVYGQGTAFTCITVDSNNTVWAGTNGNGIFRIAYKGLEPIAITTNNFNKVNIKQIAADKGKGIWVAHEGYSSATYGGVEFLDAKAPTNRTHYNAVSLLNFSSRGFPSRRVQGIAVDKNGKVWSAHSYHDLTASIYLVNPGGLGFKTPSMVTFDTIPNGLQPYPAYTRNPPITQSPGTRVCPSIAIDTVSNEVWLGGASYNAQPVFQGSRISRFGLNGTFLGPIDETNSPLPLGANGNARPIAIHFDKSGNGWVGFNLGKGFSVKRSQGTWTNVGYPAFMPAGTFINQHAIASNAKGEVFIGTSAGLLKFKGGPFASFTDPASYTLYTVASSKLPSNNVTGITVDKSGVVWICTDAGIASLLEASFTVYNLSQPVEDNKELEAPKLPVCLANDQLKQLNGSPIAINVAADSSNSTLIVYTGSGPKSKNVEMVYPGKANLHYTDENGYLKVLVRNDDSLVYLFRHPSYVYQGDNKKFVSFRFVVQDTVDRALPPSIDGNINVYHPPVLMVHGVWSHKGSMQKLADSLVTSKLYDPFQVNIVFHDAPDHPEAVNSQQSYSNWVPDGINALLDGCARNYLSAGKVDLVGHSRGGIFARIYTQGVYVPYRNDVNKLITLNTPHAGAQTADLVMDKRVLVAGVEVGQFFGRFTLIGNEFIDPFTKKTTRYNDDRNGAVELQVADPAIKNVLNGSSSQTENIPKHAIMTRYKFGAGSKIDFLKDLVIGTIQGATTLPVSGQSLLDIRKYLLSMGSNCASTTVDDCLNEIFSGEECDLVVPIGSGLGGLTGKAVSDFSQLFPTVNISHSNKPMSPLAQDGISVTEKTEVMATVIDLLRDNPSLAVSNPPISRFTKAHFVPAPLTYKFLPNLAAVPRPAKTLAADSVRFEPALKNSHYLPGDSILFNIKGNNLANILVSYESLSFSDSWSNIKDSANGRFIFPIPKEAFGKITIVAMGFNSTGLVAIDTAFINIDLAAGVILDSIRIVDRQDVFTVVKKDSIAIPVNGYYSDHIVRDITANPGLVYATEEANAAASKYGVKGVRVGFDRFFVAYQGKSDTGYVKVADVAAGPVFTINSGNWNDPAIWNTNEVPGINTNVVVMHAITATADANCNSLKIVSPGSINISAGIKLTIRSENITRSRFRGAAHDR